MSFCAKNVFYIKYIKVNRPSHFKNCEIGVHIFGLHLSKCHDRFSTLLIPVYKFYTFVKLGCPLKSIYIKVQWSSNDYNLLKQNK